MTKQSSSWIKHFDLLSRVFLLLVSLFAADLASAQSQQTERAARSAQVTQNLYNGGLTGPAVSTAAAPWYKNSIWNNDERGRLWYPPDRPADDLEQDIPPESKNEPASPKKPEPSPTPSQSKITPTAPEIAQMKAIKERMEELRTIAVVNPTPENVKNYIRYQEEQMDRASLFSDVWRRVMWESPELDYAQRGGRPTSAIALRSYDEERIGKLRASLSSLAQTHGLYFFYRSDCPYCHNLAPILRQLEQSHGLKVIAISLDGGKLPQFPRFVHDNGQAQSMGVRSVPAVFLAIPGKQSVLPIGTGSMSLSELEERIYVQAFTKAGQEF